jgi:hypothetical protein
MYNDSNKIFQKYVYVTKRNWGGGLGGRAPPTPSSKSASASPVMVMSPYK